MCHETRYIQLNIGHIISKEDLKYRIEMRVFAEAAPKN